MDRSPEGSFMGNQSAVLRFPGMALAEEWGGAGSNRRPTD